LRSLARIAEFVAPLQVQIHKAVASQLTQQEGCTLHATVASSVFTIYKAF